MLTLTAMTGNAIRATVGQLSIPRLQNWAGRPSVVPLYHAAGEVPPEHLKYLSCWRGVGALERDLDFLSQRFTPVGLNDLVGHITDGCTLPANAMHVTIDDGLREAAEVIAPLCKRKGVPATFFFTTDFLDNRSFGFRHLASLLVERIGKLRATQRENLRDEFEPDFAKQGLTCHDWPLAILAVDYQRRTLLGEISLKIDLDVRDYLASARPYLDRLEVQDLIGQGFTVGAHSIDHPDFEQISESEQHRQVTQSVARINELFRPALQVFAFPFGVAGTSPGLLQRLHRDGAVDAFFGVDWRLPGWQWPLVATRIGMDADADRPARQILAEVYAKNIVAGWRGQAPASARAPKELQSFASERQS